MHDYGEFLLLLGGVVGEYSDDTLEEVVLEQVLGVQLDADGVVQLDGTLPGHGLQLVHHPLLRIFQRNSHGGLSLLTVVLESQVNIGDVEVPNRERESSGLFGERGGQEGEEQE